jgi:uncharacterized membrane protein
MMDGVSSFPAVVTYLFPLIGWLYVFFFQRNNTLAMYHLRQSIGLCLFLAGALIVWAVIAWVLVWLPYMGALAAGLFTMVIVAYLFGVVAWLTGLIRALKKQATPLPVFGRWAERLPVR